MYIGKTSSSPHLQKGDLTSPSENIREKWRHDRETSNKFIEACFHKNSIKMIGICNLIYRNDFHSVFFSMPDSYILKWLSFHFFQHARQLSELLQYLEHHPLGSLALTNTYNSDFVIADDKLKLVDLDDVVFEEKACRFNSDCKVPGASQVSKSFCHMLKLWLVPI